MLAAPESSLSHRLQGGRLPSLDAARLVREAAERLAEAHERGVVHGDLSPASLRLTERGAVEVADLKATHTTQEYAAPENQTLAVLEELAATRASVRKAQALLGALNYKSPEQLRGEGADARSDVFALGAILYEAVTGARAFPGSGRAEVTTRVLAARPTPPRQLVSELPVELERVILKALAGSRGDRHTSMRAFAAELGEVLQPAARIEAAQPPVTSSKTGAAASAQAAGRPRPALLVGAGALLATLAAVAALAPWKRDAIDASTVLVVPFEVRGQKDGSEYLGRAFAEAIAVNLALVSELKVLPVPTATELGDAALPRADAARALGAGRMLTGAITRDGDRLGANLSLVDTHENRLLWGTRLEASESDLPGLAAALVRELAKQLGASLPNLYDHVTSLSGGPAMAASPDTSAALGALRSGTIPRALEATVRLVTAFPDEPHARALRAHALLLAWDADPSAANHAALEEALAALDGVDASNPYTGFYRAYVLHGRGETRDAIRRYSSVLERKDLSPQARAWVLKYRAAAEHVIGDDAAALSDLEAALRADPANPWTVAIMSETLGESGRFEEALTRARQAVALMPSYWRNHLVLGTALSKLERWREARDAYEAACRLSNGQLACALHAVTLLRNGQVAEGDAAASKAATLTDTSWGTYNIACYYALAGERPRAIEYLRRSLALGLDNTDVAGDPDFEALRGDRDFRELAAQAAQRMRPR